MFGYFQVMYLLLLKFVAFEQRVGDAEQCYKQATIYHTPEDPLPWYQVRQLLWNLKCRRQKMKSSILFFLDK